MAEIPLVDANDPDFNQKLLGACEDVGFVSITGHGIRQGLFSDMREMLTELFELPEATKAEYQITPNNYRGFIPLGFFTPNRAEANGTEADFYEGYKLHWDCPPNHPARQECDLYGPNIWAMPEMASIIGEYWSQCDRLAEKLLAVFAQALGVDDAEFATWHDAPLTNMTLLHYPAQPPTNTTKGIHPHKDTNVITFLHPDPVGGLLVRAQDGTWMEATPPPEAILVNIGEMLELWSGGKFKATPHQVINTSGKQRYSFPYFVVPNHSVVVKPLLECQPGFTDGEMPVGPLSAEVWRTNWPHEEPSTAGYDLGTLDR